MEGADRERQSFDIFVKKQAKLSAANCMVEMEFGRSGADLLSLLAVCRRCRGFEEDNETVLELFFICPIAIPHVAFKLN